MKNRKQICFTVLGLLFVGPIANAQAINGTSNVTLQGNVSQQCTLSAPVLSGQAAWSSISNTDATVTFGSQDFMSSTTGQSNVVSETLTYKNSTCNFSGALSLKSGNKGMTSGTTPPTGFTNTVNYTAVATWGPKQVTLDTSKAVKATVVTTPYTGDVVLTITTQASSLPLVADTTPYSDLLVLQIGTSF